MIVAEFDLAIREADPEAVSEPLEITFCGQTIRLADEVSSLPMMRLMHALDDENVTNRQTMGLIYALLKHCIAPQDWPRFEAVAEERKAHTNELLRIGYKTYGIVVNRPTRQRSDSSNGPLLTTEPSSPGSSSPGTAQESVPPQGRPDLKVPMIPVDQLIDG